MVAFARFQSLTGSIAPLGGVLAGVAAAASFGLMSNGSLEAMVWNTGLASIIPAAEPPLGATARALLALGSGVVCAAVVWSALYLLFGPGGFLVRRAKPSSGIPTLRRADAHPDHPPRAPMTAADLGTPMMEISALPIERPLPRNLDQPLAAFDPGAVLAAPREPVRPVAPLAKPPLAPGERLDTFALDPLPEAPTIPPQRREPPSPESIEALLRRLEESAGRRPRPSSSAA